MTTIATPSNIIRLPWDNSPPFTAEEGADFPLALDPVDTGTVVSSVVVGKTVDVVNTVLLLVVVGTVVTTDVVEVVAMEVVETVVAGGSPPVKLPPVP